MLATSSFLTLLSVGIVFRFSISFSTIASTFFLLVILTKRSKVFAFRVMSGSSRHSMTFC